MELTVFFKSYCMRFLYNQFLQCINKKTTPENTLRSNAQYGILCKYPHGCVQNEKIQYYYFVIMFQEMKQNLFPRTQHSALVQQQLLHKGIFLQFTARLGGLYGKSSAFFSKQICTLKQWCFICLKDYPEQGLWG